MNKYIEVLNSPKIIFVFLLSSLLLASCNKSEIENVCNLTPEQIPDVRGFRLGMSYESIKKRFPAICPDKFEVGYKYNSVLRLHIYSPSRNPPKDNGCENLNHETYPDLEGVGDIEIGFEKGRAAKIFIEYNSTSDEKFGFTFVYNIRKLLSIDTFNNQTHPTDIFGSSINFYELDNSQMLCNQVEINYGTKRYDTTKDKTRLSFYVPYILIEKSGKVAISKAQQEQEKKGIEDQKKAEDQKRRETFKP